MVPAATSVASLTATEMVTLTPLFVARRRRRDVPVDAARATGTVVTALVDVPDTTVVMVPEHAPVDSVHVPEQRCIVMVSGEIEEKLCWTPNEDKAVA